MITHEWRPMKASQLEAIQALAQAAHPTLPERTEIFAEKLKLCPKGCRSLVSLSQPELVDGYLFSHPWHPNEIPALDTLLEEVPIFTNTWYLHDLVVRPDLRKDGWGGMAVRHALHQTHALGYTRMALVAVGLSIPFWEKQGFDWVNRPELEPLLDAYGDGARYMLRDIP